MESVAVENARELPENLLGYTYPDKGPALLHTDSQKNLALLIRNQRHVAFFDNVIQVQLLCLSS